MEFGRSCCGVFIWFCRPICTGTLTQVSPITFIPIRYINISNHGCDCGQAGQSVYIPFNPNSGEGTFQFCVTSLT